MKKYAASRCFAMKHELVIERQRLNRIFSIPCKIGTEVIEYSSVYKSLEIKNLFEHIPRIVRWKVPIFIMPQKAMYIYFRTV